MQADYRVKKIFVDDITGDIIADCYDVLYGESFEKFLGNPEEFDGRENASNLLQDSNYDISDELRREIESTFGVREFIDDQDYDSYQFYDFGDDDWDEEDEIDELVYAGNANGISTEDEEEDFTIPTSLIRKESFNLREALNTIDLNTYNKYDLLNLYESCNLSENEKRALANIVYDQNDPSVIYDTLNDRFVTGKEVEMPERVKDGVIHEDAEDDEYIYTAYDIDDDPMETFTSEKDAMDYVDAQEDFDRVYKVTKRVGKREIVIYREDDKDEVTPTLPKEVEISIYDVDYVEGETDADELNDTVGDYLFNNYDFCPYEFEFDVDGDTIYVYNIEWSTSESVQKSISKSINETFATHLYLFPELNDEDLKTANAYMLKYLGKNYGINGDEENWVLAGSEEDICRYADRYLGYELHPDYLYEIDDFAGDIVNESKNDSKSLNEEIQSPLRTCLDEWNKLEQESPSYDDAIDAVNTAEQLVGYYIDRYEEEAYSTYLGNRGILSNVTPEMDKEVINLFNQITEIGWTGEYINESLSQEIGGYYSEFKRDTGIDLGELVYGKDGFMATEYPDGFPDFAGDIIYSEKHWNELVDWAKKERGLIIESVSNDFDFSKLIESADLSTDQAVMSTVDQIKMAYEAGLFDKLPIGRKNAATTSIYGPDKERLVGYFKKQPEFNYEMNTEGGIMSHEFISDKLDIEIFDEFISIYRIPQNESVEKVYTKKNGDYLVKGDNGGYQAFSKDDVHLGHIDEEDPQEAQFKFDKNKFTESKSIDLNETTDKEFDARKKALYQKVRARLGVDNLIGTHDKWTDEENTEEEELSCISMLHSILTYSNDHSIEKVMSDRYLQSYINELGEQRVRELAQQEIEEFANATINRNVHTDSEGVSYNSVTFRDDKN